MVSMLRSKNLSASSNFMKSAFDSIVIISEFT